MKRQNKKRKSRLILLTALCILVVIIIGTLIFIVPGALKDNDSPDEHISAMLNVEDSSFAEESLNVGETEGLSDATQEIPEETNESFTDMEGSEPDTDEAEGLTEAISDTAEVSGDLADCMYGLSPDEQARVYEIMSEMTLQEKIYQMMIVPPSQITGVQIVTAAGTGTQNALEQYPVGGLFYNATNMETQEQITEMLTNTQSYCDIPVLTMCDEEGGTVARLMKSVGTTQIGSMLDYESQGPEAARQNAQTIASDMSRLGFNLDLAPVADVWSNPSNTVIAERAYSTDFDTAAELIPAAVEGFHLGGVGCTLKHFPGHGDTSEDSHYSTAIVDKSLDELRANELLPFQAGIDAGADAVMMGHLTLPQVDEQPALFSYTVVTELLREEMGFQGVVMTDALEMAAVSDYYSSATVAVNAVSAGVDMLLGPVSLTDAVSALEAAVNNGTITEERIDESVARILSLKIRRGIL